MKKGIVILIIIFSISSCGIFKKEKTYPNSKIGWYYLSDADNENGRKVKSDIYSEDFYLVEPPIVNATEFKNLEFKKIGYSGQSKVNQIEIELNEKGKIKWAQATENISKTNEIIVFVVNDKVISKASAIYKVESGFTAISSKDLSEKKMKLIIKQIESKK